MPRKKPESPKISEDESWREDASKLSYEEALQALDVQPSRFPFRRRPLFWIQGALVLPTDPGLELKSP